MKAESRLSKTIKTISCAVLAIFGLLVFVFALLSGAETYGGGFIGIVKNSPNALAYALLLMLIYVGWRWPLMGGILITSLGFGLLYFFGFFTANRSVVPFVVGMIPIIFGVLLIFSWGISRKHNHL